MTSAPDHHPSAAVPLIAFDNSYARLPQRFFARVEPGPAEAPELIKINHALAIELGLDPVALERDGAGIFSGNHLLPGSEPLAMAYAGHQYGQFVPQLGDGRAILLGEVIDIHGQRRDIQLKGPGQTPFSRRGDGRAALGPVLREYLISEAMYALGIPATRALAAVTTGQPVYRERMLPGAVFTRVAASHIRVGTFQFFAARSDAEAVRTLADHVIARHYPALAAEENPYTALFSAICDRQAALIARWMHVGFIHGVMNTDNMTVSGETIDFGPCAFMDTYNPATVFSSIDANGRYAYANQPGIGQWNLARLAEAMLSLFDADEEASIARANDLLSTYGGRFQTHWLSGMRAKLGLFTEEDGDLDLVQAFLTLLQAQDADFTLAFRGLSTVAGTPGDVSALTRHFTDPQGGTDWLSAWTARIAREEQTATQREAAMRSVNPAFIPRNHRVEEALNAAIDEGDFSLFEALLAVLAKPYEDQPQFARYASPPLPDQRVLRTFCGT